MTDWLIEWWTMCLFWMHYHGPGILFTFII